MPRDALSPVIRELAALIEECAHLRACSLQAADNPGWAQRALCAEAAGRELLLTWLRPTTFPAETSLGAELRRLLGLIQTLLLASSPFDSAVAALTVLSRHVELSDAAAWVIRDVALLIVLAAREDGALHIVLSLDMEHTQVRLRVESDQPGLAGLPVAHSRLLALHQALAPLHGIWTGKETQYNSWLLDVRIPSSSVPDTPRELHDEPH